MSTATPQAVPSAGERSAPELAGAAATTDASRTPRRVAEAAALGAIAVAILVLVGWVLDIETLKRIAPGLVAMNPATAVAFALCGLSLWLQRHEAAPAASDSPGSPSKAAIGVARAGAAVVLTGALLKLGEVAGVWSIGLDRVLFSSRLDDAATGFANRMAPNTALNFALIAAALLLLDARLSSGAPRASQKNPAQPAAHRVHRVTPAQMLALCTATASSLAILGYAYGTRSFYGVGSYIPMALHTALTFLALVAGILCARPRRGVMKMLLSRQGGGAMARRLLPAAILIPPLLGWARLAGQRREMYDNELGASLLVVATMVAFGALVWWTAGLLERMDARRERAESERNQAAAALAQSLQDLEKKNAHMQADLDLAREIQQAFLPQQYISFPRAAERGEGTLRFHHRYEPNATLGGDFSDILLLSDTQAGVLICDVMGHGVRSALVTAIVRGLAEETLAQAHDPGLFLTGINRSLLAILQRTSTPLFATAFYVVADTARGELRYSSAGHPTPLLLRRPENAPANGDAPSENHEPTVQVLPLKEAAGGALGLFEDSEYASQSFALRPDDLLVLYTDGLSEVANATGEEFDESRLLETLRQNAALPPEQILEQLIEQARLFSNSASFDDDVCLVAMEVARAGEPRAEPREVVAA